MAEVGALPGIRVIPAVLCDYICTRQSSTLEEAPPCPGNKEATNVRLESKSTDLQWFMSFIFLFVYVSV